ncbi:MAG: dihydrolipoyl dehydrogenase [Bdellovibrionales bacterium]|nr:dihydrolipoyl dehydrogenase [Bdellovibrionales bacterium]
MEFDLIVIGAGPAGYTGAIRAAQLGLKTAVVEKSKTLGGTCLNVGCIPSKALLESSEHFLFAKEDMEKHGIQIKSPQLDLKQMLNRKNEVVQKLTKGIEFLFKKNKITRVEGWARLKSSTEVSVTHEDKTEIIKGKYIMLAGGSAPTELPFAPFDKKVIVSSTEALDFSSVPKTLVVIGGGYIGLELGSVWNRLGSQVTVVEQASTICPSMDKDIREKLQKSLIKQGLKFHLNSSVKKAENKKNKGEVVFSDKEGKEHTLNCEKILVCVGRKPFFEKMGLNHLNIKQTQRGQVEVDKNFKTSVPNIFAVGDLIEGPMLAHKAEEEGVAVAEYIAKGFCHVNYKTVPSVIYTWPEAASVGLTEEDIKLKNIPYKKGLFPFSANGRALSLGFTEGFVKTLAHKETDKILGVHILGPRAGDLIAEAVLAMEFGASSEDIARSFHAHPTLAEAVRESALAATGKARQM